MPYDLPAHPDLVIESAETVWKGRFPLQVVRFRNRRFDGRLSDIRTWELWRRGRAGAVLPYDPVRDCVVLIDQFRLPAAAAGVEPVMVEVPAGLCGADEDPGATAEREAEEEAGLTILRRHPIGDFLLTPGGCDERVNLYAGEVRAPEADATGLASYAGLASENEDIRVRVWPAHAAIEAALSGGMPNVVTAVALLWLAARREFLRKLWSGA
jgi:ADP-ribose pyrophosphatase